MSEVATRRGNYRFGAPVRVRWQECDAQGIAFNGSYLGWLEVAQAEYFRNLGFSIYRVAANGYFDSAVVKVTIEYKAPVRVDEMLDLRARVGRIGNTSLTLEVAIFSEAGRPRRPAADHHRVGVRRIPRRYRRNPDGPGCDSGASGPPGRSAGEASAAVEFPGTGGGARAMVDYGYATQ